MSHCRTVYCFSDSVSPKKKKQEPYGHLTSASAIIDRFDMASVGKNFKGKQQVILTEICHCCNPFVSFQMAYSKISKS